MNCVICQKATKYVFAVDDYSIFECRDCGHRMTRPKEIKSHVNKTYSDNYFFCGGAGYPNYLEEKSLLIKHGYRYGNILAKYIRSQGKVLDVGSAAGFVLRGLIDVGWEGYGVEPNETMAEHARNRLGLNVKTGTIESFQSEKKFDLVCLIQVIAHLVDPNETLQILQKILSKGGFILVETWNYRSWTAKSFGKLWHEYSPPSVLHWFCPESLNYLFSRFNFEFVARGRPSKKIIWKHAKSLILYNINKFPFISQIEKILTTIPDKFSIPYPSEDLFWSLYKLKE